MLAAWLDNIYGAWFVPGQTLARLRQDPVLWQGALVVALISAVDATRQVGGDPALILVAVLGGWLRWLSVSGLLGLVGFCLGREVRLSALLTLQGFAGLPWLLVAPAQAFGSPWGGILTFMAVLWWLGWQLWAVAVAFDLAWWRLAGLIPLAFVGGLVALSWILGGAATVMSLV